MRNILQKNHYRKFGCFFVLAEAVFLLCIGVGFFSPHASAYAPLSPTSITLSADDAVDFTVRPTPTGAIGSSSAGVSVTTNAYNGYNLSISSSITAGDSTNRMVGPAGNFLNAGGGSLTAPSALANSQWGFSINANPVADASNSIVNNFDTSYASPTLSSTWAVVPAVNNFLVFKNRPSATSSADQTSVHFAARADSSQAPGAYTRKVLFTAVANEIPSPVISSITPNHGPMGGGTVITITGTNFASTTDVTIDGTSCLNIDIVNDTTITCTTPAHVVGAVDVVVTTQGGTNALTNGFTYDDVFFSFRVKTAAANDTFYVPTSAYNAASYNWLIDWGDGTPSQTFTNVLPSHTYATTGDYVVRIHPATTATNGWFNAFGFTSTTDATANSTANKTKFTDILTPFPAGSRTLPASAFRNTFYGVTGGAIPADLFANLNFAANTDFTRIFDSTFYGWQSAGTTIPAGLFTSVDTSNATLMNYMFNQTFAGWKSANVTIPAGLFTSLNTAKSTRFVGTFNGTFTGWTSPVANIPAGLFASLNTSIAFTLSGTFYDTFSGWTSKVATIPSGLFSSLNTSLVTDFTNMFYNTFLGWTSPVATIPSGLFSTIDSSIGATFISMFNATFSSWASTSATIPAGIFNSITVPKATSLNNMFKETFNLWKSPVATIPANVFSGITVPATVTSMTYLFGNTFSNWTSATPGNVGTILPASHPILLTTATATYETVYQMFYNTKVTGTGSTVVSSVFNNRIPTTGTANQAFRNTSINLTGVPTTWQ